MKKIIITLICLALAAMLLTGCSPAAELVTETTEKKGGIVAPNGDGSEIDTSFKDYVICSDSFAIYQGEYNCFFWNFFKTAADDIENQYGVDLDKGLKDQYVGTSETTWFEFFRDQTLSHMKELLYVYELALDSEKNYAKVADEYLSTVIIPELKLESGGNPSEYIYDQYSGTVLYQNYLNAVYLEYIYKLYVNDRVAENFEVLTDDEVKTYSDTLGGEKDETPTRRAVYIRVTEGKNKTNELIDSFKAGEMTVSAFEDLAKSRDLVYYNDAFIQNDESYKEIAEWLFAAEREVGDLGTVEIKDDAYYAVFFYEEGEAAYLYEARLALANEKAEKAIADGAAAYSGFKTDAEKLNDLDV